MNKVPSISHPVTAWTVVELSLLGSVVGQIVSWLTHQEGGTEQRVRGEKAGGIKGATAKWEEGWGRGTEVHYIHGESSEQQGYFRARYILPAALNVESLVQTQRKLWLSDACRLWYYKILSVRMFQQVAFRIKETSVWNHQYANREECSSFVIPAYEAHSASKSSTFCE